MLNYKEYIYAIYQEHSFSKAAQKLYVSQPWLSSVVKKVEQEIKTPIFDRSTNPISLTPAGQYYIRQVEQVMQIEADMRSYFDQLQRPDTQLHVGSSMFFCTYVLPQLFQEFREENPQITLTLTEGGCETMAEKLLEHKLDVFLEAEPLQNAKIQSVAWCTEELVLAVPARFSINQKLSRYCYSFDELLKRNEPGGKKPAVPLDAFRDEPFLLLQKGNDSYQRSMQLCEHAGFVPKVSVFLAQMMTAFYLVCEGQGVSFLRSTIPEYVTPTESVVFYQLDDPIAVRSVYLSSLRQHASSVQQKLLDFMWNHSLMKTIPSSFGGAAPGGSAAEAELPGTQR